MPHVQVWAMVHSSDLKHVQRGSDMACAKLREGDKVGGSCCTGASPAGIGRQWVLHGAI